MSRFSSSTGQTSAARINGTPLDRATVEAVVAAASRAPSLHNTQPWKWQLESDRLELHADRERQLHVADPDGHSLRISCGAAWRWRRSRSRARDG